MVPRILVAKASDFQNMDAQDWVECISKSDGRTLAAEVMCTNKSPVDGVTHGEIAVAMGADIVGLNYYDPVNPNIDGCPDSILKSEYPLAEYKRLVGCPIGIKFLCGDKEKTSGFGGRDPKPENIELHLKQGADIFFLYAIRRFGCTLELLKSIAVDTLKVLGDRAPLFVNPAQILSIPRTSNSVEKIIQASKELLDIGCHGIVLPMSGGKPGWMLDPIAKIIDGIHQNGGIAWLTIQESMPSGPIEVIKQMALQAKMVGTDVSMFDYSGIYGMPDLMNIFEFSLAVRGKSHTYFRMSASILR